MSLSDLPQSILFIFFLMFFVLIGNYPAWKRTAALIRKFLNTRHQSDESDIVKMADSSEQTAPLQEQVTPLAVPLTSVQLNDFDIFVLRRLAQSDGQALTRKQLDADLFLGIETIKASLETLLHSGLVQVAISPLLSIRFYLSEQGRDYAVEQDYIPRILGANEEL